MTTVIHVNANLQWRAERGRGSDHWIGFCDALGISTEAESLDELHTLIPEAIHLLMVDLFEDNELDEFLHERGWSSNVGDHADGNEVEIQVPWFMVTAGANGQARAPN